MTDEQLVKYAKRTLGLKGIDDIGDNLTKCINALKDAFETCYYSVCIDIDGTICKEGEDEVSEELLDALANLVKAGVNICFITGRGKSVKSILKSIVLTILDRNADISFSMFRRWYCVIHNGVSLLSTIGNTINDFLAYSNRLISDKDIEKYDVEVNKKIESLFSSDLSKINMKENDYKIQLEDAGTRFIFFQEELNIQNVVEYLTSLIYQLDTSLNLSILQGCYRGNTVLEYSICNKGDVITGLEQFMGIPKSSMLRIGDQGSASGNDFEMLDCKQGFSVKDLSNNPGGCFPFLNLDNYNIETGPNAAAQLLRYFTVATAVCLEKPNKERYILNLASVEKMAAIKSKEYLQKYSNITSAWISKKDLNQPSIYNIFDVQSGAIKFKNYEWELIPEDNEFKKLFKKIEMKNCRANRPNLIYALMTDTSVILRGVNNYYYGLCFRRDKEIEGSEEDYLIDLYLGWIASFRCFMDDAQNAIDSINISALFQKDYNRKFLFGIMDSIRNMLLTLLNAVIERESEEKIYIWHYEKKKAEAAKLYEMAYEHTAFMYKLLFGGLYSFSLDEYKCLYKKIRAFFSKENMDDIIVQSLLDKDCKKNFFRVWRETDIFVENVIAVDIALTEFGRTIKDFDKNKVMVHGIRYGSIELPIICQFVGEQLGIKIIPAFVGLPGKYSEKHNSLEAYIKQYGSKEIDSFFKEKDTINILTDDNLMTGRTLQILINDLAKRKCYLDGIIIVRYPSVNRIPHMLIENHGCPNIDLFFNLIKGLVSSTPYSRLFAPQDDSKKRYLDETNVFNKSRQRICRYLFKNGVFDDNSEVKLQNG